MTQQNQRSNARPEHPVYTLKPYNKPGLGWTFRTPVEAYPWLPVQSEGDNLLVAGINTMLETIQGEIGAFELTFSDQPLPDDGLPSTTLVLEWVGASSDYSRCGWNDYRDVDSGACGSLCPVLLDYYPTPPQRIYLVAKPLAG